MHRFLDGLADDLEVLPCLWVVDVTYFKSHYGVESISLPRMARSWYQHGMPLGRVLIRSDYAVLRANRADTAADSRNPRVGLISLMKILSTHLPNLRTLFRDYPLPADV